MNEEIKRESVEERVISLTQSKVNKINTFSSQILYVSVILLNILTLILSILYINNISKIEKFSIVLENIRIEFVTLIIAIFIFMMCLKVLPNFLKVYNKTKKCRFGLLYSAESVRIFYDFATVYSTGATSMYVDHLIKRKVSDKNSLDVAYSRNLFERISHTIFYSVIFIIGLIFWLKKDIPWWLLVCTSIPMVVNFIVLSVIFSFKNNKKSTIKFVASLCTIMYRLHLTKNYEKLYTKITDNLMIYDKQFKQNKALIFTEIVSYILAEFLKCVLVYYVLVSLNLGSVDMMGDVVFRVVLLEMILLLYPFRNGCIIYELLFVLLFKNIFFEGYVFWGMLIIRLVTYFFYIIQYFLIKICNTMQRNKKAS